MALPTVTVRARVTDQSGQPIAGATLVAVLDRAEVYAGVVVPTRATARSDESGVADLVLFPNDLGVNGSSYNIVISSASGHPLYQSRAAFPPSEDVLPLYAFADRAPPKPVSLTEQQLRAVRAARAEIAGARVAVSQDAQAVSGAAHAVADDRAQVADLNSQTQQLRNESASQRAAAATAAGQASDSAQAAQAAATQAGGNKTQAQSAQTAAKDSATSAQGFARAASDSADAASLSADRSESAADQLEQLITENTALRALVAIEHGRPLLRDGRIF